MKASEYIVKYSVSPYSVQGLTLDEEDNDITIQNLIDVSTLYTLTILVGAMEYFTFDDIKYICANHPSLKLIKFCIKCLGDFSEEKKKLISIMNSNGFVMVSEFNSIFQ
jgi:hypothetical protein